MKERPVLWWRLSTAMSRAARTASSVCGEAPQAQPMIFGPAGSRTIVRYGTPSVEGRTGVPGAGGWEILPFPCGRLTGKRGTRPALPRRRRGNRAAFIRRTRLSASRRCYSLTRRLPYRHRSRGSIFRGNSITSAPPFFSRSGILLRKRRY